MYIRNGQPFDINVPHTIDDVQYPVEWFQDVQRCADLDIYEAVEQAPPAVGPAEVVTLSGYTQDNGLWVPQWQVRSKTLAEIQQDADMLAAAKIVKRTEINSARDAANGTSFPFKGKHVQCDSLSKTDILGTALNIAMFGTFPVGFPGAWKYMDNSYEPMPTVEDFKPMYAAFTQAGANNFQHAQDLKAAVAGATSIEDLAAIVW